MEKQQRLPVKRKYAQDWAKYNLAKTNEKRLFYELLRDLSKIIKEPRYEFGRPPIPIKDLFFSAGLKLYSNYSGRKVISDIKLARDAGYISQSLHYNTLTEFLGCPATYDLLQKLLIISAMPLKKLENKFSMDASGFGSYQHEKWHTVKWGKKGNHKDYVKGHIIIGTKTNVICSAEVTYGTLSDVKQAPALLKKAGVNFNMEEVSADKAYGSKLVYRIIKSIGAIPYIPFKHNTKEPTENSPEIWNKMFLYFRDHREDWEDHYHKRSNVETVFSMVKLRLGEYLRCKTYTAQRNELLMKFICHNICCLIQEIYERNLHIDFKRCLQLFIDQKVENPYPDGALGKY